MKHVLYTMCFIALCLQGVVTTLPLVLSMLLLYAVLQKDVVVVPLAFFSGLVLDTMLVKDQGITSFFFLLFLGVVVLYERKFEVATIPFIFLSSLLGSMAFLLFSSTQGIVLQAFVNAAIAVVLFIILYPHVAVKKRYESHI